MTNQAYYAFASSAIANSSDCPGLVDSEDTFTVPTVTEDELARITAELRRASVDASSGAYEGADELIAEMAELVALGELDQSSTWTVADGEIRFYPRVGGLR